MKTAYEQTNAWAIETHGLTKSYGDCCALRGVDLKVKWGEFLAIFGPNGAGKTTILKVLATLTKPSSGDAYVGGFDMSRESNMVRRQIGVVTHQTLLYDDLSAYENLKFYGKMYDVPHLAERIPELLAKVGLEDRPNDPVRTLSRGMQQRVAIARALIHDPSILLLDEPGTGLDQQSSDMLVNILNSHSNKKRTVVMTTHSLEQGLSLSNRVVILNKGKIAYEESKKLDVSSFREVYYSHTGVRY